MLFLPYLKGISEDNYQRNYNLFDDFYAQYFADNTFFKSDRYQYVDGWASCAWTSFYTAWLPNYYGIIDNYTSDSYKNMRAIADIWICYGWQRMTDRWGDIPYTNASRGKAVPYMSQQSIYEDLLKRVQADCAAINVADLTQYNPGTMDIMYQGKYAQWQKFGYSLLLRMAMRLSNVDATYAKPYAQAAISGGLLASNNDNAWMNQDVNGWYDYYNNIITNWQNAQVSMKFINMCTGTSTSGNDPRLSLWCIPGKLGWVGLQNGQASLPTNYAFSNYATINQAAYFKPGRVGGATTAYSYPVMNYAEVLFLQSEAALKGWTSGDYNALYQSAINASMAEVGASSTAAAAYIAGLPALTGANEASFQTFMTQKWLALYPNSVEAWAEFRRTGYPLVATDYISVSPNATVTSGNWVGRLRYINNEHDNNASNIPAAYNTYTNDRMEKCVWWAQQNSSGVFPITMNPKNF
jgi:hypothetical protein